MVEAVAMLPVFIILFVGLFFVRDSLVETQRLDTLARSCAWRYSKSACTSIPPECIDLVHPGSADLKDSSRMQEMHNALKDAQNAATSGGSGQNLIYGMLGDRIGGWVTDLFSRAAIADPAGEIERPPLFGGGTVQVKGHYKLACDLQEVTPGEIALEAWNLARGKK